MNISEFVSKQNTTIDTVKYYIKLGLLTPEKKNNWYSFSLKEVTDFQNIVYLKSLGLSLELIKKIKDSHEYNCGTITQWENNLAIINREIENIKKEQDKLTLQEKLLLKIQDQLNEKIKGAYK